MTVTDVETDRQDLTLTITSQFSAPVEQIWRLWEDPRMLEQWWGPPSHPATVTEHDLRTGGIVRYHMTGPDGDVYGGWWRVTAVEPPHRLEFIDGFADEDGEPNDEMPTTHNRVTIADEGDHVRMTITAKFASLEAMEELIAMGMQEGIRLALGQIDHLLQAVTSNGSERDEVW